jgi:hypothetical protein
VLDENDLCPDTATSDPDAGVPSASLGTNRWADIDGDGEFETTLPKGNGPARGPFTLEDTGGCGCAQIIEAEGLGAGHVKHGCSAGAMLNWVASVAP